MMEYSVGVFGVLAIFGAISLICYGSGNAEKIALGIIAAFIIISPIIAVIRDIDPMDAFGSLTGDGYETDADPSYVAEEAFAGGIKSAVSEKFSIKEENISVRIVDFDIKTMSCEQIKIYLDGVGAFADYRSIEDYVGGLGMGDCSVEIVFGKG